MKDKIMRLSAAIIAMFVIALGGTFVTAQPAQASEVNRCFEKAGALHGGCMFVEYYHLGSGQIEIRTVKVCVQVAGRADSAVARSTVKVFSNGNKLYDRIGEAMIYSSPIDLATEKCQVHSTAATVSASDFEVLGSAFGSRILPGSSAPDIFQSRDVSITNS